MLMKKMAQCTLTKSVKERKALNWRRSCTRLRAPRTQSHWLAISHSCCCVLLQTLGKRGIAFKPLPILEAIKLINRAGNYHTNTSQMCPQLLTFALDRWSRCCCTSTNPRLHLGGQVRASVSHQPPLYVTCNHFLSQHLSLPTRLDVHHPGSLS